MNTNMYIRLLNNNIDPDVILKQVSKAGPEGINFLFRFLSSRCKRLQTSLNTIQSVALEIDKTIAQDKLFSCMLETTDAVYATIYMPSGNRFKVAYSNWPVDRQEVLPEAIYGLKNVLRNELVNVTNVKSVAEFSGALAQGYRLVDPDCLLSCPIYGDGMKVAGLIELVNKKTGPPYFSAEDVFIMNALASFATLMNNHSNIIETSNKKQDDMKTFLSTATKTDAEMGGPLNN